MTEATHFNIGLTQWNATLDVDANLAVATDLVIRCASEGADLVMLPENGLCLGTNAQMRAAAMSLESLALRGIAEVARDQAVPVLIGGFKRLLADGSVRNTALIFGPTGEVVSTYDKIHLFDARIDGQTFSASSVEQAGSQPVLVDIGGTVLGITICYDVRFPELYRQLALAGAQILLIPAAFTHTTGRAHWEPLLRARAIENGCFVAASATVRSSTGHEAFETYGHALAVDPWGSVLADLGTDSPAARVVSFDLGLVQSARSRLPVLKGVQPQAYGTKPLRTIVQTDRSKESRA